MDTRWMQFFKALSNEDRIKMIMLLGENGELCAQDIEKHFFLEQSTTSHHLNTLKRAGIAKTRKAGRNIYYSMDYDQLLLSLKEFMKTIHEFMEEDRVPEKIH